MGADRERQRRDDRGAQNSESSFPRGGRKEAGPAGPGEAWGPGQQGAGALAHPQWGCKGQGPHRPEDRPPPFVPRATSRNQPSLRVLGCLPLPVAAPSTGVPKPQYSTDVEASVAPSPG